MGESTKQQSLGGQCLADIERSFLLTGVTTFCVLIEGQSIWFLVHLLVRDGRQAMITHLLSRMLLKDDAYGYLHRVEWNRRGEDLFSVREPETICLEILVYSKTTSAIMSQRKDT